MLLSEFEPGMARLHAVFGRGKRNSEREAEYFTVFQTWNGKEWDGVVGKCVSSSERYPVPGVLFTIHAQMYESRSRMQALPSCPYCDKGRIRFTFERNDIHYERYTACDCFSGDAVARQMLQLCRLKGRPRQDRQCRYGYLFGRFGGLETAKSGVGLSVENPAPIAAPEPEDDDITAASYRESSDRVKDGELPF